MNVVNALQDEDYWRAATPAILLNSALQRALLALDLEESLGFEEDPSRDLKLVSRLQDSIQEYQNAAMLIQTALRGGSFSPLRQNALTGCLDTYNNRVTLLQTKIACRSFCGFTPDETLNNCSIPITKKCRDQHSIDGIFDPGNQSMLDSLYSSCLKEVTTKLCNLAGQLFKGLQAPATNILLYGSPGTAEALAGESGFKLLSLSPSSILSKWSGESEKLVKGLFELAKKIKPVIIFFDEIDAFGLGRTNNDEVTARRIITELLVQMNQDSKESPEEREIVRETEPWLKRGRSGEGWIRGRRMLY